MVQTVSVSTCQEREVEPAWRVMKRGMLETRVAVRTSVFKQAGGKFEVNNAEPV